MEELRRHRQIHSPYNDEPVLFCKHCLSLKIRNIEEVEDSDYCDNCGSTSISEASIHEWEGLYKFKYGKSYLEYKTKKQK